jgi:hypothetical protein
MLRIASADLNINVRTNAHLYAFFHLFGQKMYESHKEVSYGKVLYDAGF